MESSGFRDVYYRHIQALASICNVAPGTEESIGNPEHTELNRHGNVGECTVHCYPAHRTPKRFHLVTRQLEDSVNGPGGEVFLLLLPALQLRPEAQLSTIIFRVLKELASIVQTRGYSRLTTDPLYACSGIAPISQQGSHGCLLCLSNGYSSDMGIAS